MLPSAVTVNDSDVRSDRADPTEGMAPTSVHTLYWLGLGPLIVRICTQTTLHQALSQNSLLQAPWPPSLHHGPAFHFTVPSLWISLKGQANLEQFE